MASRLYSMEELLALIPEDEEAELDDPNEVMVEGSDEEYDDLEDYDIGMCAQNKE